ncbi:MAG: RNA polymerase sigma factor [Phycisphaerales bacterium]
MADAPRQSGPDDEQLVLATLRGDIPSFGLLVERYWKMVLALALSRIHDSSEAEDIAQESFLKAYSQLHTLRDPRRFAGWLAKIAMQQCVNAVRRDIRHKTLVSCETGEPVDPDTIPAYSSNPGLTEPQIQLVQRTVGRLPEKLQRLIIMRFTTGLSAVQIAEQLGKRPGTVRVWLHRAYKILRSELAPLLEEVEP